MANILRSVSFSFFILYMVHGETIKQSRSIRNQDFDGQKLFESEIANTHLASLNRCTAYCASFPACRSFNYNKLSESCVIFDRDFIDVGLTDTLPEDGWLYYYLGREVTMCSQLDGGEVAKVDRELKQHCIEILLASKADGDVIIQGTKNAQTGTWKYDDGSNITFFNWDIGQPENFIHEIHLTLKKTTAYKWHDATGNNQDAVVCQQK